MIQANKARLHSLPKNFTQNWLDRKWVIITQKWLDQKWVNYLEEMTELTCKIGEFF
jgi:hypothetical protein